MCYLLTLSCHRVMPLRLSLSSLCVCDSFRPVFHLTDWHEEEG